MNRLIAVALLCVMCSSLNASDAEKAKNAIGLVQSKASGVTVFGSATYIGKGWWITASHVVSDHKSKGHTLSVVTSKEVSLPAIVYKVVGGDSEGCAAIKTSNVDDLIEPIEVGLTDVKEGQTVYQVACDSVKTDKYKSDWVRTLWPSKVVNVKDGWFEAIGTGERKGSIGGNAGGATLDDNGKLLSIQYATNSSIRDDGRTGSAIDVSQKHVRDLIESMK